MRREIASRRQVLREAFEAEAPVGDVKKLLKKLERVADVKRTKRKGVKATRRLEAEWRSVLAARLMRRAKRLGAALDEAGPLYAPDRLHGVRISAKKLRYALEIARDAGVAGTTPLLNVLKRHQDRLGHLHDLQMLLKHVRETETSPAAASRAGDLTAYAESLDRECRRLHAGFVEQRAELATVVKEIRRQIAGALTTPSRRQAHATSRERAAGPARSRAK